MNIKASDFLKYKITPFIYGLFFSGIRQDKNDLSLYVYTDYKNSKAVINTEFDFLDYAKELCIQYNKISGYDNWGIYKNTQSSTTLRFNIINDLGITPNDMYKLIYQRLLKQEWLIDNNEDYELNDNKKHFIRGFMETRGSVDTQRKYIAQDYFYNNQFELKRIMFLTDIIGISLSYLNFNPRQLQPQYYKKIQKRNTQFRINLCYYAKEIGFINKYKAKIFENAHSNKIIDKRGKDGVIYFDTQLPKENDSAKLVEYLNFFTNNIYKKELTEEKVIELRKRIGFRNNQSHSNKIIRNKNFIELFDSITEDKCALCGTTKTFKKPNGKQDFEIHHMVPAYNGQKYDNIANLVKLCSTCHDSLKKGRASKETQISNIIKILHENDQLYEYATIVLGLDDINKVAQRIYEMLG